MSKHILASFFCTSFSVLRHFLAWKSLEVGHWKIGDSKPPFVCHVMWLWDGQSVLSVKAGSNIWNNIPPTILECFTYITFKTHQNISKQIKPAITAGQILCSAYVHMRLYMHVVPVCSALRFAIISFCTVQCVLTYTYEYMHCTSLLWVLHLLHVHVITVLFIYVIIVIVVYTYREHICVYISSAVIEFSSCLSLLQAMWTDWVN